MVQEIGSFAMTEWQWNEAEAGWLANLRAKDLDVSLVVAGSPEAPDATLCSIALSTIENAGRLRESIANYLHETPIPVHSDGPVLTVTHNERPSVDIVQIELRDPTRPNIAHIFVNTGYPDPYYLYDVELDGTAIVNVVGGFW